MTKFNIDIEFQKLQGGVNTSIYQFYNLVSTMQQKISRLEREVADKTAHCEYWMRYTRHLKSHISKMDEQNRLAKIKRNR